MQAPCANPNDDSFRFRERAAGNGLLRERIEALLESSQRRVTGTVNFTLRPGSLFIDGVDSPHSLLAATKGVYGESAGEWTPEDTLGYARILSLPGSLQTRASGDT